MSIGFDGVWVHEDTAGTLFALDVKGHSDVTGFSPGGSPGVSDDSIVDSVFGTVTDGGDGVIKVVSSSTVVEDTSGVTLEVVVGSIDGDASWSSGDGGFQGGDVLVSDGSVGCNSDNSLGFAGFARSSLSNVWVRSFELHWVGHSILESVSFHTSIATTTLGIAINELRLGELEKRSGLDEVSTLHGSSGGEGPAGTTLSLVLNSSDHSFANPIDSAGGWWVSSKRDISVCCCGLEVGRVTSGRFHLGLRV